MAETDTPHQPPLLLPDAAQQEAKPATAPLRLETTQSREALLDGAWWPRSHNIEAELPTLVTELTSRLGPIARVGLDSAAWEELPTRLIIDDRVVHLDAHEVGDGTALVTRGDGDYFVLLVVPPESDPAAARAAMARAVRDDNITEAAQLLVADPDEP
ncbi:DUF5994 family protein [Streptomyces sp. NPDC056121]|uniref:DUF5994 family protein n=1 Tax=Streptomyces TaxID=1883 RepID=UPI001D0A87DC|nr:MULTISPECIES: DUF5994 family protein [Streptomyces]MCX5082669.1 DUF5994 family protein [Streptomyces sp. NBC_00401]UDM00846.1 DUF5994 family protein [Streptomyces longhuiensis]